MVSPGATTAATICCMCGDQGLPGELFQCAQCLHRLQHRYCSDQYPRMAAYSICNWCVREKEVCGGGSPSLPAALATRAKQRVSSSSRLNVSRGRHDDMDQHCADSGGCSSRSAFPAELQKPVKKPKKSHDRVARRPAAGKGTDVQNGGARTKPRFRGKARTPRYKLITEVIRCK